MRGWRLGTYFALLVGLFVASAAVVALSVHVQTERDDRRALALVGIGLAAVLFAAWLLYRYLVVPIGRLRESVRAMKESGVATAPAGSGPAELAALGDEVADLVTAVNRELLERRRAEAEGRAVLDAALDAVVIMDDRGLILEFNPAAEAMFGRLREDVLGAPLAETLIPPSLHEEHYRGLARYLANGEGLVLGTRVEMTALRADGTEFPVELAVTKVPGDGPPVFTGFIRDVTELREKEERLRRYSERLARLSEIQHAILTARSVDEIADAAVSRLREGLGVARATVTLFAPESDDYVMFAFDSESVVEHDHLGFRGPARLLGNRSSLLRGEIHVTEDLRAIPDPTSRVQGLIAEGIRSAASIPLVAEGELLGTINLFRRSPDSDFSQDLLETAREVADELALALSQGRLRDRLARHAEELEERVVERTAELEAANRELEAFSYSVSHDLRAPLRAIDGFSRILEDEHGAALPEDGRRYLRLVSENAQNLGKLIDGLLDFSRLGRQALSRQPVDLGALVQDVLADLAPEREGRSTDVTVQPLPTVSCDRLLVKQVFANLLSNALKFTRDRETAHIVVGSFEEHGERVVFVRDNGVGFDMRHANKLFGVFQRLHRAEEYEGTGLGLALVGRIVVQHGGRIWAEGAPGEGACFSFTLEPQEPM
jgi:PAS domain S-box-containing protein